MNYCIMENREAGLVNIQVTMERHEWALGGFPRFGSDVGALNFDTLKQLPPVDKTYALSLQPALFPTRVQPVTYHVQPQQHTNHTQPVWKRPTATSSVAPTPTTPSYI